MPLLRFLRLGKIFVEIINIDEGLRKVVIVTDALEPGGLGGETYRTMDVAYGFSDAGEFVHVIDGGVRRGSRSRRAVSVDGGVGRSLSTVASGRGRGRGYLISTSASHSNAHRCW